MRFHSLISILPYYLFLQALGSPVTDSSLSKRDAQTSTQYSSILDDETEKFVNKVLSDWKSPGGIAIAFVRKDENGNWVNIETKGYGRANYKGDKVTEQTNFNVGSNSKLFTAVATGLLVNNASLTPRLRWDSRVSELMPEVNLTDPIFNSDATLVDLGSHRTGYPRHEFSYLYSDTDLDLFRKMALQRQSTEFRSNWQYDNNMYTILSYLPEKILGEKFARYVKRTIFDPLNMTSSTYSFDIADKTGFRAEGMAREYINYYNGDTFSGNPRNVTYWASDTVTEDGNLLSGSGGVITNAIDVAKWLQTLLLNGKAAHNNQTVIPPTVLPKLYSANAIQSNVPAFPEESSIVYGIAQVQITYRGHLIVEHPGFIRGFNTQISRLPNDNIGVAVLTNDHDYGRSTSQIIKYYVMDRALGLDTIDWNTRLLKQQSVPPTAATPRPVNASLPDAPFASFTGNYTSERLGLGGYGSFELCLVQPPNPDQSAACKKLADSIPTALPGSVRPNIPTYFGAFNSPWFTHMRMEHFNGNIFNISLLISTPTGDAKQPYWTFNDRHESDNLQTAETVFANGTYGIGMAGLWSGVWVNTPAPVTPKPTGNTPYERAEFFWDKVEN